MLRPPLLPGLAKPSRLSETADGAGSNRALALVDVSLAMEKVPMTIEGFKKLEAELHRLKAEERPRIIQQISDAREHGDLAENAEYHAAKEAQGLNEAKVAELEDKLGRAEVIDTSKLSGSTVKFGATVTLEDEDSGDKVKYMIVGEHEANVREGKISIASPIARALIGKGKGDSAEVTTPRGSRSYEILKVEYK
jgi:transcription elongation factor GreA